MATVADLSSPLDSPLDPPLDPRAEALLYVRWLRGAFGRFDWGEPGGAAMVSSPVAGATPAVAVSPPAASPLGVALGGGPGDVTVAAERAGRASPGTGGGGAPGARTLAPAAAIPGGAPGSAVPLETPVAVGSLVSPGADGDVRASGPRVPERGDASPSGASDAAQREPVATPDDGAPDPLADVAAAAAACRRCRLCETRTNVVFGEGPRRPRLLVIGEAPGADEDESGRPFVGPAGQLLTKMLAAIGLAREDVYIANVVKCRPPGNRVPAPDEMAACRPYLEEQVRLLDPELLLLLGAPATKTVLGTEHGITAMRGQVLRTPDGRPAVPTYHPAYLLRTPEAKREAWLDLQLVASTLGISVPPRSA